MKREWYLDHLCNTIVVSILYLGNKDVHGTILFGSACYIKCTSLWSFGELNDFMPYTVTHSKSRLDKPRRRRHRNPLWVENFPNLFSLISLYMRAIKLRYKIVGWSLALWTLYVHISSRESLYTITATPVHCNQNVQRHGVDHVWCLVQNELDCDPKVRN